ncbi:MAG: PfkB family carbohydrate kinase [Chlamydiales bacterium]
MYSTFFLNFFLIANLFCLHYSEALSEIPQEHRNMLIHHPYRILCVGAACIDQLMHVSEEFLDQVPGEKGGSDRLTIDELNGIKDKLNTTPILAMGGSSANTIKGLANLGEKCGLISHVGNDPLGDHIVEYMKTIGVTGLFTKSSLPTTQVLCLITPDGQRTMRLYAGCSQEMNETFLHPEYFKDVKLVHFAAYSLHKASLVEVAMQLGRDAQALVSLDLASFEMVRKFHGRIMNLLEEYVDIVFTNGDEVFELLGLPPEEGCLKLQEICPVAIVMLGDKGCLIGSHGTVIHSPAFPVQVVDTTGAGDFFASGFIYGYLRGYPLDKCACLANRLASEVVSVQGAELPPEKWVEMRELLRIGNSIHTSTFLPGEK